MVSRRASGAVAHRRCGHLRVEDGSVSSKSSTLVNGEIGYQLTSTARVVLDGFNLLDAVSDIDYFYRLRLPGEPAAGFEDVRTRTRHPRALRLGVQIGF